jgi:hypothetical protein
MNAAEISFRLFAIGAAIIEKTGEKPWYGPQLIIRDNACHIDRIIAALPDLHTAKLHGHMARVADCIDKAHADGIADEYVTPLRTTIKAMSDNLLAGPVQT